ncbi:MAG: hypothetical protein IR159_09245 [Brevundimonas sp.]|nr:hypothetical protein [Brevundimonas sp.]
MPRDRRRRLTEQDFLHALQEVRLRGLETGRYEPLSAREALYLRLFQAGDRPDREDFIVSPPLLRLETAQMRLDADLRADDAPPPPVT